MEKMRALNRWSVEVPRMKCAVKHIVLRVKEPRMQCNFTLATKDE